MIEEVREVEILYVQNTTGDNYSVETAGRRTKSLKLNFSKVEGVEIDAKRPLEIRSSFLQMTDGLNKMWNMRFVYPTTLQIQYKMGKILIEVY